ncbi:heat shock cognate 70 kDa protein-like [Rosa rugosa]|uniref:heat shock cognate 70 kDa protein-like n=1 Tax=Rosa rugosa TaxID=74645 RepID=UPI002B4168CB|nr:heat shock cognate 70 kDa protein-like [Rosa rugosa]
MAARLRSPMIGIDLGTGYSSVGVWNRESNCVEIIADKKGNTRIPNSMVFTKTHCQFGVSGDMEDQLSIDPDNTIVSNVKRLIGRRDKSLIFRRFPYIQSDLHQYPFQVTANSIGMPTVAFNYKGEPKQLYVEAISAMVVSNLVEIVKTHPSITHVSDAVITVPCYFTTSQRGATIDAARMAGLQYVHIVNDSTAAALAYGFKGKVHAEREQKNLLVFDLGAGSLDVSLVRIENGRYQVIACIGDTHLGGNDFDKRMVDLFVQEFQNDHKEDISANPRAVRRLAIAYESAKRTLSSREINQATIHIDSLVDGINFDKTITRDTCDQINMDLYHKCVKLVDECLKDAAIDTSSVSDVLLLGGSSKIPMLQELLESFFKGTRVSIHRDEEELVAYGAALLGAMLTIDTDEVQSLSICDVATLSVSRVTSSPINRILPAKLKKLDVFNRKTAIFPRKTPLPTKKEQNYSISSHNFWFHREKRYKLTLYEGHDQMDLLGTFEFTGIPKGASKITVSFEINHSGFLFVTAEADNVRIEVTCKRGRLTDYLDVHHLNSEVRNYMQSAVY